ncbi:MAG: hypothetical protein OXC92_07130 [Flavobacteriaceae bacterium]|nr:hypothetical protein [Flavobacteriaceae bacterium]
MIEEQLFRKESPKRTYQGLELKPYSKYKTKLAEDFNHKCGYTDCNHVWFGGIRNFHIDHLKPKSKYPHLETKYSNLVYSCPPINIAKSDDDFDYLDPCDDDLNKHFYRTKTGEIFPFKHSNRAKYMYYKLKLYLKKYSIIYMLEEIRNKMTKLELVIKSIEDTQEVSKIKGIKNDLTNVFFEYLKYLE